MEWPEPIQSVQCLVESGINCVPSRYMRLDDEKPSEQKLVEEEIPIIDISGLCDERWRKTVEEISYACRDWGCFQLINHGVSPELLMAGC